MISIGTQNVIIKAIDLLGPNGENWLKGNSSLGCQVCLRTALDRAAKSQGVNPRFARIQVSKTLHKMNLDPYIPGFNDDVKTTFAKVKEVLDNSLVDDNEEE